MEQVKIAAGDVVELLDHRLTGWSDAHPKGEIIERDGDRCKVRVALDTYHRFHEILGDLVTWFPVTALKRIGAWNSAVERSDFLFGKGRVHSVHTIMTPFNAECVCMHHAHDGTEPPRAAKRIQINFWGGVYEFDACAEHTADLDGLLTESEVWGKSWSKRQD